MALTADQAEALVHAATGAGGDVAARITLRQDYPAALRALASDRRSVRARVEVLAVETRQVVATLTALHELHARREDNDTVTDASYPYCGECLVEWPCRTAQALGVA